MMTCSIEDCEKVAHRRGWCRLHYRRWLNHGNPMTLLRRAKGEGGFHSSGYWRFKKDGREFRAHILIAEAALGRKLKLSEIVHHVDCDRSNNKPGNLVLCPSQAYHALIHQRMRALDASGNAGFRKCKYCKNYNDPATMSEHKRKDGSDFHHRECENLYRRESLKLKTTNSGST